MASKYHLLIKIWKILLFQLFCKIFIIKLMLFRPVSASLSYWLLCLTFIRHFNVFVKYCHQFCSENHFCSNLMYFTLFSSFMLIFMTIYTMLYFHTVVSKDPYFLTYIWICLLLKRRLWRHHNDVIYQQLKADVTSKEKLELYCSLLIVDPHVNDTRGLRRVINVL